MENAMLCGGRMNVQYEYLESGGGGVMEQDVARAMG